MQHPRAGDGNAVFPAGEERALGQCEGGDGVDFGEPSAPLDAHSL